MRFTCIALAAVALALAKPSAARGVLSSSTQPASVHTTSDGVIDFTPVPAAAGSDDAAPGAAAAIATWNDPARCVAVRHAAHDTELVVIPCAPGAAQTFTFAGGEIRGAGSLCVTAPAQQDFALRPVTLAPCTGAPAQRWELTPAGEYRESLGRCLTAAGPQRLNGTPVAVRRCMGRNDQQWAPRPVAAGVHARVDSIRLNAVALSLGAGSTAKVNGTALDADGCEVAGETVSWASSDPSVATVSADGTVVGVGNGTTTVIAMSQGRVKSVTVEVRAFQFAGLESGTPTFGADHP